MQRYSLEQVEVLMMVAGSDDPVSTALLVQRRWRYLLSVALAAQAGQVLDHSLPQVMTRAAEYAERADAILAAIAEWLQEHHQPPAWGAGRTA